MTGLDSAPAADRPAPARTPGDIAPSVPGASALFAPHETPALIDHILERFHATHRRELADLIRLARKVEAVHAGHPLAPVGLADALVDLSAELETHMAKEELILFPMMRAGGSPMIAHPLAVMRHEHEAHGVRLRALTAMTGDGRMPEDACRSWQALTAGVRKLVADVTDHIAIENDLLFPRFAAPEPASRTTGCGCAMRGA